MFELKLLAALSVIGFACHVSFVLGGRTALKRAQRKHVIVHVEEWSRAMNALALQEASSALLRTRRSLNRSEKPS